MARYTKLNDLVDFDGKITTLSNLLTDGLCYARESPHFGKSGKKAWFVDSIETIDGPIRSGYRISKATYEDIKTKYKEDSVKARLSRDNAKPAPISQRDMVAYIASMQHDLSWDFVYSLACHYYNDDKSKLLPEHYQLMEELNIDLDNSDRLHAIMMAFDVSDDLSGYDTDLCDYCKSTQSIGKYCPACRDTIKRGYDISMKTGTRSNGMQLDSGTLWHARRLKEADKYGKRWAEYKAICGTEPGKRADWSTWQPLDREVTCKKCKVRL